MSTPTTPSSSAPKAPVAGATKPAVASSTNQPSNEVKKIETPTAAQPAPRMMKVNIEGKEIEMPENEVLALASAGKVSTQRFQEAAAMRKQAEDILKFAKANPTEFFKKTGMNARQWAEEYLLQELQIEAMSPEQKKARENEEELRKYKDKDKQDKERELSAERERLTNVERERLDKLFTQALFESGLPRTPFTVKRMAELQLINIKRKLELSPGRLAQLVREDYIAEQKALLGGLEGDNLLNFLGTDIVKKLSKAQIAKLKGRGLQTTGGQRQPASKKDDEGLTWRELQKRNRKPL